MRLRDLERREGQIRTEYEGAAAASKGVLEPFVTGEKEARLRQNAVEALTISSLIDAATNRLTSAQRKADRAVEEKYGPLLEEQDIKLANLDIILKSPAYSRAEKERAEKQKEIEEKRKEELETKKTENAEILETATEAAKGGADSLTLDKITKARTPQEAVQLAAPFLKKEPTGQSDFEQAFFREKGRLPTVQELLDFKAREAAAGRKPKEIPEVKEIFTKEEKARLAAANVSPNVYENITKLLLGGIELDKIRDILRQAGEDSALLDRYDRAVGIETIRKTPGTKASVGKSKLDALIERL